MGLPMPFVSAWDPRAVSSGSIDPLGALRPFTAIATTLLPGVTTITTRVRYLSWVCAGLRLLDEVKGAPAGGRAGRARRQRVLAFERWVALATGTYALENGLAEDHAAWRQLRGVSYVRRAVAEGVRSAAFPMLRNQAGVGGVGTYWVTLVAGGLVEDGSGALTGRGVALADAFLASAGTPERGRLKRVMDGAGVALSRQALVEWGEGAHLGAAKKTELRLLGDALLEPPAHRLVAAAMGADAVRSDRPAFESLGERLEADGSTVATRLVSVLAVAAAFEALHRELLFRFDTLRWAGARRGVALKSAKLGVGRSGLRAAGEALEAALDEHRTELPPAVAEAVDGFWAAVRPVVEAQDDARTVEALVRHHERVQAGKLDASRQPKLPWVELRGQEVLVAPRYALESRPEAPDKAAFTHPYRLEQLAGMLEETGLREVTS